MTRWFVVQTNPREEGRALHYLDEKGVESFFPKIQTVRYKGLRNKMTIEPMFPSYLFTRFKAPEELPYVRWTRGVKKILGADDKPIPVGDEVVEFIMRKVDEKGVAIVGSRLKPNDRVRILSGPFKDLNGIFERVIDDRGWAEILLTLVGYHARVQLHESLLERISPVHP
jgi:transcriptional antiterminator RfaH